MRRNQGMKQWINRRKGLGDDMVGIDLFAGAGGMSLGAEMAGIDVRLAVEKDASAAETYKRNHPKTVVFVSDIATLMRIPITVPKKTQKILFGGPPCQGFSISNRRTRTISNPGNWLFKEFIRIAYLWKPEWIVLENVKGIEQLNHGDFLKTVIRGFRGLGYTCSWFTLCASDYGVPQIRNRFFLIGSLSGIRIKIPQKWNEKSVTVGDAIGDLPSLSIGANIDEMPYRREATTDYAKRLRGNLTICTGNLVSKNSDTVVERYSFVQQGGNWEDVPDEYMSTYADKKRCHTGIYRRLSVNEPSVVIGNYRKNMLIHPFEDRGLSVREAARLQSFPDSYVFCGNLGAQQQQVGNAVPPYLAREVFRSIERSGM